MTNEADRDSHEERRPDGTYRSMTPLEGMAKARHEWRYQELKGAAWEQLDEPSRRLETNAMRAAVEALLEPSEMLDKIAYELAIHAGQAGKGDQFITSDQVGNALRRALLEQQ